LRRIGTPPRNMHLTPAARHVLLVAAMAAVLLVAFRIHGFSISMWHQHIDGSSPAELLLGEPRAIRSDDWMVHLPLALAQSSHEPAFPIRNENIGAGLNMLVPFPTPIAHPLQIFRPTFWGFLLGDDVGMAWKWWTQILGLFAVWFLVFLEITGNRTAPSVLGGLLLLFSPFLQFWSFNAAPVVTFTGLCFLGIVGLLSAERPRGILGNGLLLGWAAGCLGLTLYPPYLVILGYLLLAMVAGTVWDRREELQAAPHRGLRALAVAVAAAVALAAAAWFYVASSDAIAGMLDTAYPGDRVSVGGGIPVWRLLSSDLWIGLWVFDYGSIGNICEAASFWLMFPVVVAGLIRARGGPQRVDGLAVALAVYCGLVAMYAVVGLPEWFSRATLFSQVPGGRAILGLGVADALLLLRFLSRDLEEERSPGFLVSGAVLWGVALAATAWPLREALPELPLAFLLPLAALNGALAYLILRQGKAWIPLAVMVVGVALSTAWFNPVVVGGSEFLRDNPLSRKIRAIDQEAGGDTVWISYGPLPQGNLFRMLGVRSVNGVHPVPQLEFWRRLDPDGSDREVYNRYAHVAFVPGPRRAIIELVQPDLVAVRLHPGPKILADLGVTHLLLVHEGAPPTELAGLEHLASYRWNHMYRVSPVRSSAASREDEG